MLIHACSTLPYQWSNPGFGCLSIPPSVRLAAAVLSSPAGRAQREEDLGG